ncbi:MAG TPA: PEP-CTERM sorting domain-containing protein [Tepidisphaeraceae bacterium]|nr:PEP-CTERM sorting domain-containing protein [Tepidisphaeraceae bacterium]
MKMGISRRRGVSSRSALLAAAALVAVATATPVSAAVYSGNGATGFGGAIGGSTLTVIENGSNIDFSLSPGVSFSGNALVLYVDNGAGGVTNTSTLTDNADGGRTAISGLSGSGRTLVNFAPTFDADLAITLEPGSFSGLFNLATPSNFGFVSSGGLSGSGTGPFTFSYSKAALGVADGGSFDFVGTLISTSGYRSNETIGLSVTTPGSAGDAPNAGFTGTQTFSTFGTFTTATPVPEPTSLGLLALGGVALLRRRHAN